MVKKFRKKPVVIEAVQFHGANVDEVQGFIGDSCRKLYGGGKVNRFIIHTLEGDMIADLNDWIIRGVKGEHYPCKPDIFAATYEASRELTEKLMANEGSTKPTYSELERLRKHAQRAFDSWETEQIAVGADTVLWLLDELTRVRGLLQRQWISVEERLPEPKVDVLLWLVAPTDAELAEYWKLEGFAVGHLDANVYGEVITRPIAAPGEIARQWPAWSIKGDNENYHEASHWAPALVPPNFPQASSLVPQGAESVDIGKLDTADKAGVEMGKVNRVDDLVPIKMVDRTEESAKHRHRRAGAETGGEKAAPQKCIDCVNEAEDQCENCLAHICHEHTDYGKYEDAFVCKNEDKCEERCGRNFCAVCGHTFAHEVHQSSANDLGPVHQFEPVAPPTFRRSSQNQTLSSGVDGAHEGTTADKSGSREPEKLNNAQLLISGDQPTTFWGAYTRNGEALETMNIGAWYETAVFWRNRAEGVKMEHDEPLAESSLSSPPPCTCPPIHLAACPLSTPDNYVVPKEK